MPARYTCSCSSDVRPDRSCDAPVSVPCAPIAWSVAIVVVVAWSLPAALLVVLLLPHAAAAMPTTSTAPSSLRGVRFTVLLLGWGGSARSTGQTGDADDARRRPSRHLDVGFHPGMPIAEVVVGAGLGERVLAGRALAVELHVERAVLVGGSDMAAVAGL